MLFHFDGNIHFIRVRTLGTKCFFADGLNDFRKAHNLNESVILRFVVADKNTTFTVHVDGPTHCQSRLKPVVCTYIFTTDIIDDMIQNNQPLVSFTTLFSIYNSLLLLFSFHSSSNSLPILCVDHTDTSRSSFQIHLWFKEKYYHTARPSKTHPVATQHPQ